MVTQVYYPPLNTCFPQVTPGWLEPLASHIKTHPKAVAIPLVESIDGNTLKFNGDPSTKPAVGSFSWSGHFMWDTLAPAVQTSPIDPVKTPTMPGGKFAVSRDFFWKLGGFDEFMRGKIGGESLEMSFRYNSFNIPTFPNKLSKSNIDL